MGARLTVETSAARLVGRLSRAAGRGGGTTLPGKLLWKVDPGAVDALAARLPAGVAVISATNGKTTTSAMVARIVGSRYRLAWNNSGANLASGVASTLLASSGADLGLLEVDEFALPEVMRRVRPRVISLGNLFRDQLDRYGELEHIAERWRDAVAALPSSAMLIVNADDPLVAELADGRSQALRFGVDDPRLARPALQHAADSKYCVRCGAPYDYAAAYVGHLGDYRCRACGHARPPLDIAARSIDLQALDASVFDLVTPAGTVRVRLPLPGLYNVYNALAAAAAGLALDASLDEIVAGLGSFVAAFGRFERIEAGDRRILMLLIKNPAGANEAVRTLEEGGVPATLVIALNDRVADGRDVSWIWDVDFEPLLARVGHVVASGQRAAELALRFTYAGFPPSQLEVIPDLREALDRGLALVPPGGELGVLPTYTAMLELRAIAADRGLVRPFWEESPVNIGVAHLYPDYLNIYADRGNIAVFERRAALRGHTLRVTAVEPGDRLEPSSYDLIYVGGGQDREQALVAPDLARRGEDLRDAVESGTALLAVCGGYQLLGRGYRGRDGSWLPGAGLFPLETVAGERRLIGDVLLEVDLDGMTTTVAGFENHAGRTLLDAGATALGEVLAGHGNDGTSGFEGCRVSSALGTYLHGPLLPRNPALADWLLARALEHAGGDSNLEPLEDALEHLAHAVSASRARSRGGN